MTTATKTQTVPLSDFISVADRFHRSVSLSKDWEDGSGLEGYLVTPTARRLAERMLGELGEERGTRAWSMVGPYGAGKSAFALFLTHLLSGQHPDDSRVREIREAAGFGDQDPFIPILISSDRSPLPQRIAAVVGEAFSEIDQSVTDEAEALAEEEDIPGESLAALLEDAADKARAEGYGGLLLAIDEFGKFLEFAAAKPDERDLLFLQTVAEAVSRFDDPVLFLTILHQGFADYLPSRDEVHRQEWQKVQGRFREVAFQLPVEQLLVLLGRALNREVPESVEEAWTGVVEDTCSADALDPVQEKVPVEDVLPEVLPLHPLTALLLWPLFRSKMAQNERSLFAFLTTREPFGFRDYLSDTVYDGETCPPLFDLERLYDYVENTLALGSFRGEQGRRWAEIRRCLGRLPGDADRTAERLVKAIGLLSMYGPPIGLTASSDVLELAVNADPEEVEHALSLLREHSIVVFRKHRNAYGLWEGSDVDLDTAYQDARRETSTASLAERLQKHVSLQPIVARAHYIESGTLRFFDVRLVDADPAAVDKAFSASKDHGDGSVVFAIGLEEAEREDFVEEAKALTSENPLRLVAIPEDVVGLDAALRDLEIWRWVRQNVAELKGDEAARNEVKARISHARDVVENKAGQVFGLAGHSFRPDLSSWVQGGDVQPSRAGREFQRWLSGLCDSVFDKAPALHNELLNRQSLSSASSAARRNLIEAMMTAEQEERLGIEGTPAEASMYASVLRAGGFHQERNGRWQFGRPDSEWDEVWDFLEEYFSTTARQRRLVSDLFETLQEPPFGLREGPIPVIFLAFALAHWEDFAFYEDGVYVPDVSIEVVERLLSRPETFEIQTYALTDEESRVLAALADRIEGSSTGKEAEASLLPIVRDLVRQAASLEPFTKRTRELDPPEALQVRDALLDATSPRDLLFEDLPQALGVTLGSENEIEEFAESLRESMRAIKRAYPALLDQIETALRNALSLPDGPSVAAVASLRRRAEPLVEYALEDTLQVFVREAARLGNQRDWREVLGRVVQGGMPPSHWSDKDLAAFQVNLRKVAGSFERLEELAAEEGVGDDSGPVYRLGVLRRQFEERRAVVRVDDEIRDEVSKLADELLERLSNGIPGNGNRDRIRVAALAQVSESLLVQDQKESDSSV